MAEICASFRDLWWNWIDNVTFDVSSKISGNYRNFVKSQKFRKIILLFQFTSARGQTYGSGSLYQFLERNGIMETGKKIRENEKFREIT